jgi:hypothetical protein
MNRIELKSTTPKMKGKFGQPLQNPLVVRSLYKNGNGQSAPVSKIPIHFSFLRGAGDLLQKAASDEFGEARSKVLNISSKDKLQIIQAQFDFTELVNLETFPAVFKNSLDDVVLPNTRFIIEVSPLQAMIQSEEYNLGKQLDISYVEPTLKNILSDYGFTFTEEMNDADFIIELKAESKRGSQIQGIHSAFANLTIMILDLKTGSEIYKNSLQNVKGLQLNFENAGLKALENSAKALKDNIIPEILDRLQKKTK